MEISCSQHLEKKHAFDKSYVYLYKQHSLEDNLKSFTSFYLLRANSWFGLYNFSILAFVVPNKTLKFKITKHIGQKTFTSENQHPPSTHRQDSFSDPSSVLCRDKSRHGYQPQFQPVQFHY